MVAMQTRGRWAVVALGVALLLAVPTAVPVVRAAVAGVDADPPASSALELVGRALGSSAVAHSATAETRGTLGLPDLPALGGVAGLLGGTTRTRVWWSSAEAWRVDTTTTTGERGDYGVGADVVSWDYEGESLTFTAGVSGLAGGDRVRLPRAEDLLPPQAARRVLASVGPDDRLEVLGRRLVAGRVTTGVRAVPGDDRSTLGRVDVWIDDATGLPLELRVVGPDGLDALVSTYLDVRLGAPPAAVLEPPAAPGARREVGRPDVVSLADLESPWVLPDQLAGLSSSPTAAGGTAAYGDGLTRFAVVPITSRLAGDVLSAARRNGALPLDLPRGEAALVGTPLLNLVVARGDDRQHAYVVAGLVGPSTLEDATRTLLAEPPPPRSGAGGGGP